MSGISFQGTNMAPSCCFFLRTSDDLFMLLSIIKENVVHIHLRTLFSPEKGRMHLEVNSVCLMNVLGKIICSHAKPRWCF